MLGTLKFNYTGKVAVITGGSMGIGEATVRKFAEAGATTVIADINEEKVKRFILCRRMWPMMIG